MPLPLAFWSIMLSKKRKPSVFSAKEVIPRNDANLMALKGDNESVWTQLNLVHYICWTFDPFGNTLGGSAEALPFVAEPGIWQQLVLSTISKLRQRCQGKTTKIAMWKTYAVLQFLISRAHNFQNADTSDVEKHSSLNQILSTPLHSAFQFPPHPLSLFSDMHKQDRHSSGGKLVRVKLKTMLTTEEASNDY